MRIMIWCANLISAGGGARLLSNLLPAMARQEDIDLVRLVISSETSFKERIDITGYPNIDIVYFSGSIQSSEGNALLSDCHVVYFFWPHGPEYVKVHIPAICTFHDTTVMDFVPHYLTGAVVQQCWRESKCWIENMTSVAVSSHHVKSRLIEHFGPQCNEVHVIEHAILPSANLTNTRVTEELALRLPQKYVVYPSNVSPHKNHYNLLLAYSRFTESNEVPLVLFGYNTELLRSVPPHWPDHLYVPALISLMKRVGLHLDKDVYPMGFIKDVDVIPVVRNAQALIMPSMSEGGGSYPVEEALRLGVPVLCSDIPVMREHLARHSADIVWFDPESPDSIAQALNRLFDNYEHYKASAVQGMNDASETWDDVAKKYIHIFRLAYMKHYSML
ncbi:glycosyltransferase [Paenibacillus apiarius]|uniref:Glycosyltransferase n=1 Tax=Paenibacillus apiarius TaxID=46240 RepID=A0ABT4DR57_9BACL|nr:glycosyltransferase [Paenibacillus apiarius]MCY9512576.1 glycosyltransferase [Paenibacillus apiarius]MCY9519847.1 glycosyltransferase [Paenibacillus apiarius]MCY9553164.1 glycosyltransferase [Paenibacillus apiarius]MCY9559268.1 glycosyltransferase [Paenibacillus apiarius]MCY9682627.1 glycosyltransferase [Paenibacillus apiarius]